MSTPPLSFHKATFEGDPAPADSCAFCHRMLEGEYFRVSGHLACSNCAQQTAALVTPDSHKAFSKALLFGACAALAGCIGYALFEILTGIMLGWAAIGVGFLVGWAMRKGSGGLGGRRYQIAAALLTYAAVSMAAVPVALHSMHEDKQQAAHVQSSQSATESKSASGDASATSSAETKTPEKPMGIGMAILTLLGIGLVSPFLEIASSVGGGLLNLFIVFLGIQMAWKHMRATAVPVEGPFTPSPL